MARKADNKLLHKAKSSKCDEFYTMREDIERELVHYEACFRDKVVYCNCDDYNVSNFYLYFKENFLRLKLKKLIVSCYKAAECNLFESGDGERGFYVEFTSDNVLKSSNPIPRYFSGNGDFRSNECVELLKKADVVVTNPPFSLFREFIALLCKFDKRFLVIGNINAITYKEIFSLIQNNKIWLGVNIGRGISGFIVPDHYELFGTEARIDEYGRRIISPNNCMWITNLETPARTASIALMKSYIGNEALYPKYDNYDGINVNRTQDIPGDYTGVMGVPITFLHKYNPAQFEIIKFRKGDDDKDLSIHGKCPYFRILIRNKKPVTYSAI